ncbi:MAG: TonB-dependent receptor [Kangiella sp.]|nr:MAG: TonB-dependent receptor [Kangiella sp.]
MVLPQRLNKYLMTLALIFALACGAPVVLADQYEYFDDFGEDENELADYYGDEDFVSIATGRKQLISKAPAVASVITAQDIKNMGANTLNEVLERVPNLHVSISNLSRHDPVFSIRGIQTGFNPQILVLLNGTEFKNSGSGGLPFIFNLSAQHIERVEIIRGPGSAVYGADAFSGIINIITKSSFNDEISVGGRVGSFSSKSAWLRTAGAKGKFKYSVALEKMKTDGDKSRVVESDLQSILDQIFLTSASNSPGYLPTNQDISNVFADFEYGKFRMENWYWDQNKVGLGPGGAQAIDYTGYQSATLYRTKFIYSEDSTSAFNYKFDVSRQVYEQDTSFTLLPAGTIVPIGVDGNLDFISPVGFSLFTDGVIGNPGGTHTDIRTNFVFNFNELNSHKLRLGMGWLKQEISTKEFKNFGPGVLDGNQPVVDGNLTDLTNTPDIYLPNVSRTVKYLSLQDEWILANDWALTAGIRYDTYSDFGNAISPRLALVWQTSYNLTTKFLYGRAFRPPSFIELQLQNNPVSVGNDKLIEEDIDTFEVVFNYAFNEDTTFDLSLFKYEANNIIDVVPDVDSPTRTYQNSRNQEGYGFEYVVDWSASNDLNLHFNFAYQSTKAKSQIIADSTFEAVADVPGNSAYLSVEYTVNDRWKLTSQTYTINDRKRIASDLRGSIANYSNTNLSAKYVPLNQNIETVIAIKNLFDKKQREPSDGTIINDYLLEQRSFWLTLIVNF